MEQSDHDIMIELRTEFRAFRDEQRNANLQQTQLYSPLAGRITALENVNLQVPPLEQAKMLKEVYDWMKDVKNNWKFLIAVTAAVGTLCGAVAGGVEIFYYIGRLHP